MSEQVNNLPRTADGLRSCYVNAIMVSVEYHDELRADILPKFIELDDPVTDISDATPS